MRPISRREKKVVGITGGILCVILLYAFGIQPFLRQWRQAASEMVLLEVKLKRAALLAKKKSSIEEEFKTYGALLHPQESGQMKTQALAEIEKTSREQSLKVLEMRPLPTRRQGPFQEYLIEVSLEGTMDQLVQFIYQLQGTIALLRVERLQISAKGPQGSLLKAVMTVSRLAKE